MRKLIYLLCLFALPAYSQTLRLPLQKAGEGSFYISEVIDGRKDTLNNGSVTIGGKKTSVKFENGLSDQLMRFSTSLYPSGTDKLPVVLIIRKLTLSDRPFTSSRIYKADITLEFSRRDHNLLTKLVELSTWVEQGAVKNPEEVQVKNITDILQKMYVQFNDLVLRQSDDPLFANEIIFNVTGEKAESKETDTIYWRTDRKLTWEDFKGEPNSNYYAALSNCAFAQSIEPGLQNKKGIITIYIRAALLKKGSWVRKSQATNDVLKHEQLHFDIAEWQVRKLRKTISEAALNLENYEFEINKISDIAWIEYNKIQSAYDAETKHGTIDAEQDKWNKIVQEGLVEYEKY
jgi:hypothetical protein